MQALETRFHTLARARENMMIFCCGIVERAYYQRMETEYGSKCHLLRWLKCHQKRLNEKIERETGGKVVQWCHPVLGGRKFSCDVEWRGVEFVEKETVQTAWRTFWPETGNLPNWDAVGRIQFGDHVDWLLVEAKAHYGELRSVCRAVPNGGLPIIKEALRATKKAFGVADAHDWLKPYYQFCNRLAVVHFLTQQQQQTQLLFIYFFGDKHFKDSPSTDDGWREQLTKMYDHVGLSETDLLANSVHRIFLGVSDN